jgi:hypothetical protein
MFEDVVTETLAAGISKRMIVDFGFVATGRCGKSCFAMTFCAAVVTFNRMIIKFRFVVEEEQSPRTATT